MMPAHIWSLADLQAVRPNGKTVFSCFSCGGGSTMGYKLAGYRVIGNVEIDPRMMQLYTENHHPQHPFLMDIRAFNQLDSLPDALFHLDILDGSPPCTSFSLAGKREKKWGVETKFTEGQAVQRLDDLFGEFVKTAARLQPKVVIAENVRGIVSGRAKGYVTEVLEAFDLAGYTVQIFSLNAATMQVPQSRERVFFIAGRKDLAFPRLHLQFDFPPIVFGDIKDERASAAVAYTDSRYPLWQLRKYGDCSLSGADRRKGGKGSYFNTSLLYDQRTVPTISSTSFGRPIRFESPHFISDAEIIRAQTFPQDYQFCGEDVQYVCGMSVPPVMMRHISAEVCRQWLK